MSIEQIILVNLINNEKYTRKVLPYIKTEYFQNRNEKVIFDIILSYFNKYNRLPSLQTILIDLENYNKINDEQFKEIKIILESLQLDNDHSEQWLIDQTEFFCKDKAIYLALMESIEIIDDKNNNKSRGAIPKILSDAISISFDSNIGHELLDDWEKRYDYYHTKENRISFDLEILNKITQGGLPNKSLTVIMAPPYGGKSLFLNSFAAYNLQEGKNVLYITLELSEESIAQRIDANLLDVPISEIVNLEKHIYENKIQAIRNKTKGKLIIKEYPAASAGSSNFRYLLNELKVKKNFIPNIIYIDYLNICASSRLKAGVGFNMYSYIKAVCEELRGLATEFDLPIVTATQTNRAGVGNSDPEMTDVAESFSVAATADLMFALVCNDQMQEENKIMVKQIKNRYNDINIYKRFFLGIDRLKFKLYDVDEMLDNESGEIIDFSINKRKIDKNKFENIN